MKTGDYKQIFIKKEDTPHEHSGIFKKNIHEQRLAHRHDYIHDHKFSLNHEQIMDMHNRARNKTHS